MPAAGRTVRARGRGAWRPPPAHVLAQAGGSASAEEQGKRGRQRRASISVPGALVGRGGAAASNRFVERALALAPGSHLLRRRRLAAETLALGPALRRSPQAAPSGLSPAPAALSRRRFFRGEAEGAAGSLPRQHHFGDGARAPAGASLGQHRPGGQRRRPSSAPLSVPAQPRGLRSPRQHRGGGQLLPAARVPAPGGRQSEGLWPPAFPGGVGGCLTGGVSVSPRAGSGTSRREGA